MKRDKVIKQVDKLVAKGNLDKAAPLLQQLVDDDPKDWNAINRLGDIYAKLGNQNAKANEMYSRIAEHFAEDGFNLKAIAMWKKVLRLDPSHLGAYQKLGSLYQAQGLNNEARTNYQTLADHYVKAGNTAKAREVFSRIAELEPGNVKIRLKLAQILMNEGKKDEALDEYATVGQELTKQGMLEDAIQVFEKALEIDAGHVETLRRLAEAYSELDQHDKAISSLQKLVADQPDNLDLQNLLGECYVKAGRIAEAEETFQAVVEKDPKAVGGLVNMSRLLLQRGEADAAFQHFEPVIEELEKEGSTEEIESFLQELLKIKEDHIGALEVLVETARKSGADEKLLSERMARLAEAQVQASSFEEAAGILEKLTEMEPENAQHQEKLSFVRSKLSGGEAAEAPVQEEDEALMLGEEEQIEEEGLTFELGEEEEAAAPSQETSVEAEAARAASGAGGDTVHRRMAEAEVFIKYGLMDKAVEQLQAVIDEDPDNMEVHQKLRDLYMEEGLKDKAVDEMVALAEIFRKQQDEDQAQDILSQALTIDPNHAGLQAALQASGVEIPAEAAAPAPPEEEPAPPEPAPAEAAGDGPSADALEEVDFYISQEFKEEALEILGEMREEHGDHPEIMNRIRQLRGEDAEAGASESDEEVFAEEKEFFDLASDLNEELGDDFSMIDDNISQKSIDELVGDIKKKVGEQVEEEDWETHYNLGIAYKEMGLIDEAIAEFQHAAKDASRFLECCSLLGRCFIEKGMPQLAVQWYQRGLTAEGYGDEEMQNIRYELATLYETLGEKEKAYDCYRELQEINSSYRDVEQKVKDLGQELGK